jgi:hypothetical protein
MKKLQGCFSSTFQLLLNLQDPFEQFLDKLPLLAQCAATVA